MACRWCGGEGKVVVCVVVCGKEGVCERQRLPYQSSSKLMVPGKAGHFPIETGMRMDASAFRLSKTSPECGKFQAHA